MAETQSMSLNTTHEGTLIPDLFSLASSVTSFIQCRLNFKGIILAVQSAKQSLVNYSQENAPTDQFIGINFSVEVLPSQGTLVCLQFTKTYQDTAHDYFHNSGR